MRTSLGCIAIGIGFHALFNKVQPSWVPRAISSWFLIVAAAILWLAVRRSAAVLVRLSPHVVVAAKRMNLALIASAVSVGAAALATAIWLLPVG